MGKKKRLGIFCLEGSWHGHLSVKASVEPALRLIVHADDDYETPYIHRSVETPEELWFYLKKWCQKGYAAFPILYLSFHGEKGVILLGRRKVKVSQIIDHARVCSHPGIILFGSCDTLRGGNPTLGGVLKGTKVLVLMGYSVGVDWLESVAFEMMLLERLSRLRRLTRGGLDRVMTKARQDSGGSAFFSNLGFKWVFQ